MVHITSKTIFVTTLLAQALSTSAFANNYEKVEVHGGKLYTYYCREAGHAGTDTCGAGTLVTVSSLDGGAEITQRLNTSESTLTQYGQDISDLSGRIITAEDALTQQGQMLGQHTQTLTQQTQDISQLNTRMTAAEDALTQQGQMLGQHTQDLAQHTQEISQLNTRITTAEQTLSQGLNFTGDTGSFNAQLGDTIAINGDNNIHVTAESGKFQLRLSDNPRFEGVLSVKGLVITESAATINFNHNVLTKVAAGAISADSTDAINGAQLYHGLADTAAHLGGGAAVVDGRITAPIYTVVDTQTGEMNTYQNVGGAISALDKNTQALHQTLKAETQSLRKEIRGVRKDAFAGTATALAVAGLGQSTQAGKVSISMAGSAYQGQTAYAFGVSRLSEDSRFLLKGAISGNGRGHFGGVISASYTFN